MVCSDGDLNVLGDRHVGQQRRVLVHHRDPEILRRRRRQPDDGFTLKTIEPVSGSIAPDAIFINVDLPAPFSPRSACTSPGMTSNATSLSAATPSKCLRDAAHGERRHFDGLRLRGRRSDCG